MEGTGSALDELPAAFELLERASEEATRDVERKLVADDEFPESA